MDADPTICTDSERVTLFNKRGSHLSLRVEAQLLFKDIVVDSLDSIVRPYDSPSEAACLGKREECCQIESGNIVKNPASSYECKFRYRSQPACRFLPVGNGLFHMAHSQNSALTAPPSLTIHNSIFRNFLFEMNSLVDFTLKGGVVSVTDSQFLNFEKCGSLIATPHYLDTLLAASYVPPSGAIPSSLNTPLPFPAQLTELKGLVTAMKGVTHSFTCGKDTSATPNYDTCFSITLKTSTFKNLNFPVASHRTKLYKTSRVRTVSIVPKFLGTVVSLQNYQGALFLRENTFE